MITNPIQFRRYDTAISRFQRGLARLGIEVLARGARGRIVDEVALIAALREGRIRAAGLDVFEREPLPADSPLLQMANVTALPHLGSATAETRLAMATLAVDNLRAGLRGETPPCLANAPHDNRETQ